MADKAMVEKRRKYAADFRAQVEKLKTMLEYGEQLNLKTTFNIGRKEEADEKTKKMTVTWVPTVEIEIRPEKL